MFIDLWIHRGDYKSNIAAYSTYAFYRTKHILKKYTPKNTRKYSSLSAIHKDSLISSEDYFNHETNEYINYILQDLSNIERKIIKLRFIETFSINQISKNTGYTIYKIYKILNTSKEKIKSRIDKSQILQ